MGRLVTAGFEGDAIIVDGFNNTSFASGLTFASTPKLGGLRSMRANAQPSAGTCIAIYDFTGATGRTYSGRFYINIATAFPSSTKWSLFVFGTSAVDYFYIYLTSAGKLQLW